MFSRVEYAYELRRGDDCDVDRTSVHVVGYVVEHLGEIREPPIYSEATHRDVEGYPVGQ